MIGRIVEPVMRRRRARRAQELYGRWVRAGSLVFDVGANVGERTRVLLSLGAIVVAVEPQPNCIAALHRIGSDRLTIEPVALGAESGKAPMRVATASGISSLSDSWIDRVTESGRFAEHRWAAPITVDVSTLDALIGRHGVPDFCKIDVEGYESYVIAGLSRPLPLVSFEFMPEWISDTEKVVERLTQLGMGRFNIAIGESHRLEWRDWLSGDALLAHLRSLPLGGHTFGDVYAAT